MLAESVDHPRRRLIFRQAVDIDDHRADRFGERLPLLGLLGKERLWIRAVRRSVAVGRLETLGKDGGGGVEPDHDHVRRDECLAAPFVVDDAGCRADHARSWIRERIEELGRLPSMHRIDTFRIAELANGLPGCRLDVQVRIAPRSTEVRRKRATDAGLACAHEARDDDMTREVGHARSVCPYTRTVDAPAPIAPPAVIGILGGGQLGRMLALAARAMGYRVAVLDPDASCPAAAVADEVVVGGYDDAGAARRLASM